MDTSIAATTAIRPAEGLGASSQGAYQEQPPPLAPPELVGKFQALMARVDGPSASDTNGAGAVTSAVVSKVEGQLEMQGRMLDNVMAVADGNMSLVDLQALQLRSIAQLGVMSMTHTAYTQVMSASKTSVSSLMKNQ